MEARKYHVLWIDDEHEGMGGFKMAARQNGILLEAFKSLDRGMAELERNAHQYDAVLLDAKFFETEDETPGSEDIAALYQTERRLAQLPKKFKVFVLTGQAQLFDDRSFNKMYPTFYRKGIDQDVTDLFKAIKEAGDNQQETQIRHKYARAFEACNSIGAGIERPLLQILKNIDQPDGEFNDKVYYTPIRIILEQLFRAANKLGLLHDRCLDGGKVNLSESSNFLAGREARIAGVRCEKAHFPKIIADNAWAIITITGSASHTEGEEAAPGKASVAEYRKYVNSPYLLYSLTFQLLDILIWFHAYAKQNPDVEANKKLWSAISQGNEGTWMAGEVAESTNGYGNFRPDGSTKSISIPPKLMDKHGLQSGQRIEITTKPTGPDQKILIDNIRSLAGN